MNLASYFCRNGLRISFEQEILFQKLLDAFVEYNSHTNISAIRSPDDIVVKHFADSIMPVEFLAMKPMQVLDIGTGGGMPGIPLAIMLPESQFTLLDSVGKKIRACDEFVQKLNLKNVTTIHSRAEDLAKNSMYAGKFNRIVSRATAYLPTILEWSLPFLSPDGKIVLYKLLSEDELKDGEKFCRKNGLRLAAKHEYLIDGQERILLIFERVID